jgi:hypothetical protein
MWRGHGLVQVQGNHVDRPVQSFVLNVVDRRGLLQYQFRISVNKTLGEVL